MNQEKLLNVEMQDFKLHFLLLFSAILILSFSACRKSYQLKEESAGFFVRNSISSPLLNFKSDMGRYPSTQEGLAVLIKPPNDEDAENWQGPYVFELPLDPWGNEYYYKYPGEHNTDSYDIWSMGPDGLSSEDDIGNW